ncbi:MAG: superoxide dismutase family protein [Cyclobacteriaceae bacterium]
MGFSSCTPQRQGDDGDEDTTMVDGEEMETVDTADETTEGPTAVAQMGAKSGSNVSSTVTFTQVDEGVHMMVKLQGVSPGQHAIHLHEFGDCSAPDGTSAGGHWDPSSEDHGHINETEEFHYGDIGNLEVGSNSTVSYETTIDNPDYWWRSYQQYSW